MSSKRLKSNVRKPWAMYVYIAGDNNLSTAGLVDISEMEKAGANQDRHVAIQIDTEGEHEGSIRYEISEPDFEGRSHRTVINRLPEQNTGNPRYLASFVKWASKRYPATNKILVVWNHGAGFMHTPTKDIGYDDSSEGDALTMGELRWSLTNSGLGNGNQKKFAIIGFDACLMNMVEVAYEFLDLTEFVVGSQQTEPGDGWPYDKVIESLNANESTSSVASKIVQAYINSYKSTGTDGVTQSALKLSAMPALGKSIDALGNALSAVLDSNRNLITEARVKTQSYEEPTYVDLVDLASNLSAKVKNANVRSACTSVRESVDKVVVSESSYGKSVSRSTGLSIWFPLLKTDYVTRRGEYTSLRYSRQFKGWTMFLDAMLAE